MHSLREHFRCLGLGENGGSVLHGFFGLGQAPETLSLQQQMERMRRPNVLHLNFIRLAFDTVAPQSLRDRFERRIDLAIHRARQIYDQAGIGVARVQHFLIEDAFAGSFPEISGDGEAGDLCSAFSVDNDAIDAFIVLSMEGSGGSSTSPGSSDKAGKGSGIVVPVDQGPPENTAKAVSHEIGHYLGLDYHSTDENNLMFPSGTTSQIRGDQAATMLQHSFITQCPTPQEA